jgi:hypothetical protein
MVQRAVREQGVWLTELEAATPLTLPVLGGLICAARAALAWESWNDGQPALTVTVDATLAGLIERMPAIGYRTRESYERLCKSPKQASRRWASELRDALLALPAYAPVGRGSLGRREARPAGLGARDSGAGRGGADRETGEHGNHPEHDA